ncbi:Hybrid signal transduction histidine kinase J [Termitomyces sp. J132]|nr:Hybrid signal transduction histidine kinase J [Termitomyces sp. J132]
MPMLSSDYPLNNVTDIPIARIACPTCGHPTPPVLPTPATILEHVLKPPPELPRFDNNHDELVFMCEAVWPLHEQAQELPLLKDQVQDILCVCNAIAHGNLLQKFKVPVQGVVMVQLKDIINKIVHKPGQFTNKFGSIVNKLTANLANQVQSIAKVTKAIAHGDLSKQIEVNAQG